MAEFIGNKGSPTPEGVGTMIGPRTPRSNELQHGFNAMGQPVPMFRLQAALDHMKAMGVDNGIRRRLCVGAVADRLERDRPYEAMAEGMRFLDLTGTYRLMAVLLTGEDDPDALTTDEAVATMEVGPLLEREKAARHEARSAKQEVADIRAKAQRSAENAQVAIDIAREQTAHADRRADEAERRADETIASITRQLEEEFEKRVEAEVRHRLHGPIHATDGRTRRPIVLGD